MRMYQQQVCILHSILSCPHSATLQETYLKFHRTHTRTLLNQQTGNFDRKARADDKVVKRKMLFERNGQYFFHVF